MNYVERINAIPSRSIITIDCSHIPPGEIDNIISQWTGSLRRMHIHQTKSIYNTIKNLVLKIVNILSYL